MKLQGWIAGALLAGGVVFAMRGGCLNSSSSAPDQRLAKRYDEICGIARDNIGTPEKGVRKLGHYLDKNVEHLLGDWGAMFATIERIPDDGKHDERARVARDRLQKPLKACEATWQRFGEAVQADPEAAALVQRFSVRLNRTFEILFKGAQLDLTDFAHLPQQLEHVLDVPYPRD